MILILQQFCVMVCLFYHSSGFKPIAPSSKTCSDTGWSLKTVDCNFFLTDPKNSKSAKTQWFSESLYREVLVIWCFKIVRCVNCASFGAFPIKSICCTIQGLNTLIHPYTHSNPTKIHTLHPNALRHLFQVSRDTSGQQQTPTDTKEHQQTLPDTQKGCSRICGGLCWHQMAFAEVWWCLMTSLTVLCCQQMLKGCLKNSSKGIWVLFMDLFKVWMRIRLYRSGQALYGVANALYWKSSERQNSQTWQFWNIKIPKPPYISSLKMVWFVHFSNFLIPSEKYYKLQSCWITL